MKQLSTTILKGAPAKGLTALAAAVLATAFGTQPMVALAQTGPIKIGLVTAKQGVFAESG